MAKVKNPIDDEHTYNNLERLIASIMDRYPKSTEGIIGLIASPERPAFQMMKDETTFVAVEASIEHLGAVQLAITVARKSEQLMHDEPLLLWIKVNDPDQRLNVILLQHQGVVFNDTENNDRYYTSAACIATISYTQDGQANLCLIKRDEDALEKYKLIERSEPNRFVNQMLAMLVQNEA